MKNAMKSVMIILRKGAILFLECPFIFTGIIIACLLVWLPSILPMDFKLWQMSVLMATVIWLMMSLLITFVRKNFMVSVVDYDDRESKTLVLFTVDKGGIVVDRDKLFLRRNGFAIHRISIEQLLSDGRVVVSKTATWKKDGLRITADVILAVSFVGELSCQELYEKIVLDTNTHSFTKFIEDKLRKSLGEVIANTEYVEDIFEKISKGDYNEITFLAELMKLIDIPDNLPINCQVEMWIQSPKIDGYKTNCDKEEEGKNDGYK